MGLIWTLLWWLTALTVTAMAALVIVGDRLVSLAAQRFGGAYVGEKFTLRWSLSAGVFEMRGLSLGRVVLAIIEPMLGLPMNLDFVRMELFRIELPWALLLSKSERPLQSTMEITGLQLGLNVNEPEKWLAMREENAERFQQAIKDAAQARVARADAWTATVVQKLKDLAAAKLTVAEKAKQKKETAASTPATAAPVAPPAWQRTVDKVLDSFAIMITRFAVTIRDEHSALGVGIVMERFDIGRAHATRELEDKSDDMRRQRDIRMTEFALFVNPIVRCENPSFVIRPMDMEMQLVMPYIMQSLLMGAIPEKRKLEVMIAFPSALVVQMRPIQVTKLLKLLRPISFHGDWFARALAMDEAACVELAAPERDLYLQLYTEQHKLDAETGLVGRLIAQYTKKDDILERKQRLQELESKMLSSRMMYLRSVALDWAVPSGGAALQYASGSLKRRKDLQIFIASPITKYVPELEVEPMFHSFAMMLTLKSAEMQLLDNVDMPLLLMFANEMSLDLQMSLEKTAPDDQALAMDFTIERFGIVDERNVPTNVFHRLLDQNPGARHLLAIKFSLTGSGHMDVDLALEDLTLLVIFDPLLHVTKVFVPALSEDEDTEMKYLEYASLRTPPSPEQRDAQTPVYKSEVPQEYSPLMLGGMSLNTKININRCELCLLGDSASLKTHVLAFTSDMKINVVSSSRHEAFDVEFADVALQPCTIVILEDAIDLDIAGLRTILELEGEGTDLWFGYKMVVGDAKAPLSSFSTASGSIGPKKSSANMWNLARTAMSKKQIVEVDQEALKAASADPASARADRVKPGARRRMMIEMSDFAMNLSANDVGVLLSILGALNESMKEDAAVIKDREGREKRIAKAKKDLDENRFMERLKAEFIVRDVDGGGTLDAQEVASLIASVANCEHLTREEFDATVKEFLSIVDRDGSGDVSLEEFESVLGRKKLVYHRLHHGVVSLTGNEYVDASRPRSSVPHLKTTGSNMANAASLVQFWERYEQQVGASRASLNGVPPKTVQKKMVRAFKNYEYAQEAWTRLVNPSLVKPVERSPWLLTKEMDMGGRGNVIDQLLSSFDSEELAAVRAPVGFKQPELRMFVHTVIMTKFGGFYIRLIDENMSNRVPSIELSLEELAVYANFSSWEGEFPTSDAEREVRKRSARNDYGVAKIGFAVYGKYYNPTARQVEPFIENFQGTLNFHKEPESYAEISFTSDRYFQLNVTYAFMDVVKTNLATFSKAEALMERERPHIKEEGGLFWMFNETGVNVTYYVVCKKQSKERVHVETVSAISTVPSLEAHPCVLLDNEEQLKEDQQQSLKEKQLRAAFRNADKDGSGELDTEEVRAVLLEVYEEEFKSRKQDRRASGYMRNSSGASSLITRSESIFSNDAELDQRVDDFIVLADTDGSGQVSFEEFRIAISKMRDTVDRFISLEIEGFEPLHNVPISSIGHTQVYELTPYFEDVETEKSVGYLYQQGILLMNANDPPERHDLQKAFACFRRVRELDPHYEWIDSYYSECVKKNPPVLVSVTVTVDGELGLQVRVSSGQFIRNDTTKPSECLMLDGRRQIAKHNPVQPVMSDDGKEHFFVIPPRGSIPIPLDLVDVGYFAIRQTGETDWSNFLELSVREQRIYKHLTRFEQKEAKRALREDSGRLSLSSSRMVTEKMGKDVALPNPNEYVQPGKEVAYPSTKVIDNQPTLVMEKISINDHQLGTWSIVIFPQLSLHNVLPCGVEYAIVQASDCPADVLDESGNFRIVKATDKKMARAVTVQGQLNYFQYVDEVNCRRAYVESGKSIQVFGLDLEKPAMMKMRLCASESNRASTWSPPFFVNLNASREVFNAEQYELRLGDKANDGPAIVVQQQWALNSPRSITLFAPYWVQNRSGLDFRFRLQKGGTVCSIEAHRDYFNGDKEIPLLVTAPETKAMVSVRPFQETAHAYEGEFLLSQQTKKYTPVFEKVDWSEQQDISSVGTKGELGANDHSFVVAFEVLAAPGQFYRSKIFRISPRVIIVNRVPRPLQVTPMMLDKKLRSSGLKADASGANITLTEGESLVVYRFAGSEKHQTGIRLRDTFRDEALTEVGDWTPTVPIKAGEDYNLWTRGSLGDGPACNVAFQNVEETIVAAIEDVSTKPRYRIENRSTRFAFRYVQDGLKNAEDIVIKPLESHSFVWDDPLSEDRKLRVTPLNWKIPTLVDVRHIGPRTMLTSSGMYSEVYIDGSTRVFAVGDTPTYAADRQRASLNDWLSSMLVDLAFHGFGLTIVDGHPREIMNMTMEGMRISSPVDSRRIEFTLHHMQIDDMTANSLYPVVFAPLDSGFNSDKREGWLPQEGERPFFTLAVETSPQPGITIVEAFEMEVQSMGMKLNLEYVLGLVNVLLEFIPTSDEETVLQQGVDYKRVLLTLELTIPEQTGLGGTLMYFKKWRMSPFEFHLVFDSSAEDKGEGISSILGSTIGSIVGGIAHVTPEFDFDEILYENRFFNEYDLIYTVILDIVYSVLGQWYKIVGSVEMLGDPVGLATDIVDGFALAARQFKRDVRGKSMRKGQSAVTIMQTVVGAPMRSIGKVSNGLGDVVKKATDFQSQEEANQPRHVPEGMWQGGIVFGKSIAYGMKGFVKEPVSGAKRGGVKGFAKGVGRGTLQLVASPVVGTLGVVEKLSMSLSNTTHLMDEKSYEGPRRPARDLGVGALKSLDDSNVITEVELHVMSVKGLPERSNPKIVVRVYHQPKGEPAKDVGKYKSTTHRHTGSPEFNQSWLIPVTSHDTFIEVQVHHKRKPVPKKVLGYVRLSMEDIYRDFKGVPSKLLADTKAKMRLRRRKRMNGSILNEIATTSEHVLESRDDSWRQRLRRPSTSSFMADDFEDENDENDEYENDVMMLSSKSIVLDQKLEEHLVELPLKDAASPDAKIVMCIRYVNDMRRYA